MGSCNTTRNEKGGKDLLLKICEEIEATISAGTTVTATAHGLAVNDIVRFGVDDIGTLAGVTEGTFYYVKAVPTDDTLTLSASPGGAVVAMTGSFSGTIELFKTVGGLRTKSFSFSSEGIEVTNHGSNQWREMLDGAGIKSVSASGEGVYTSATNYRAMESSFLSNSLVCLMLLEVVTGRIYSGCFKITSLEISGDHDAEASYSASFESAGQVSVAQAA